MANITLSEQRLVDAWWSEKIATAISCQPYTATDTTPDVAPGDDFRKTIQTALSISNFKERFEEQVAFDHHSDQEAVGAGVVYAGNDDTILVIECYKDIAMARAWTKTLDLAQSYTKEIIKNLPKRTKPVVKEDLVPTAFWHSTATDASCYIKEISCPSFVEIAPNYPKLVRRELDYILGLDNPDETGKIVLWHGPPGTGKTHAVRALAREWCNRLDATVEVILDPELMLQSAGYMRSVLLNDDLSSRARKNVKARKKGNATSDDRPIRLIVIEDSAELFSTDCRSTLGFSRLLNLTDGLIGQGLRCIFLMTANEEVGKIDPAIMRKGRCIQELYFPHLSKKEGEAWLMANNCDSSIDSETISLAELYAIKLNRHEAITITEKFGF